MSDPLNDLATFHDLVSGGLRSSAELRQTASICRSLIVSGMDGAGGFLLFALYFESLATLREGTAVDIEKYEGGMSLLLPLVEESLQAIESYDISRLHAALDSFARTARGVDLPQLLKFCEPRQGKVSSARGARMSDLPTPETRKRYGTRHRGSARNQ